MRLVRPLSCSLALLACRLAMAQGFSSGSDGSFGPINVPAGTVTLDVPPNGIFNATTVTVAQNGVLRFRPNARNTAVYILATGSIKIDGRIVLDAGSGSATDGGTAGPGGFAGGKPGIGAVPPGAGNGPGAGGPGDTSNGASGAGNAAYGAAAGGASSRNGAVHGSPLVVPLLGGSGGGGAPGAGGGGGGGALLLASSLSVEVTATAQIAARGESPSGGGPTGYGSGGAIRIVAPAVLGQGELNVRAAGGGGPGRIRIDALDRSSARFAFQPGTPGVASSGSLMSVFPPNLPRLDVVEAAGQAIAEGAASPVQVLLPAGSTRSRTVKVQGRNFTGKVPIQVTLTPESGESLVYTAEIDMATGNPATVTVSVELPVNTVTRIFAWTR